MIKKELFEEQDGLKLYRHYSDEGYKLLQEDTGNIYDEAIDREDVIHTYSETDVKISNPYILEENQNGENIE